MESDFAKLQGLFTAYNALVSNPKYQHRYTQIDVQIITVFARVFSAGKPQELPPDIQSRINKIKETSEDGFDEGDKVSLRKIKSDIQEVATHLLGSTPKLDISQPSVEKSNTEETTTTEPVKPKKSEDTLATQEVRLIDQKKDIGTRLHKAITESTIEKSTIRARALASVANDLNFKDEDGNTPLHLAINNNCHLSFIKFLIQKGADLNVKDKDGMTPLQLAVINDCPLEVIKFLIQNGADVNIRNEDGDTLLHIAILLNNKKLVEFFLEKAVGLDAKNISGLTPIHCAMNNRELAILIIDKIVQTGNLTILNIKDKNGLVPLMIAARTGQIDVVNHLTNKADFTAHDNDGYNALHHAILKGNEEMAKLLIEKNIKLNEQGKNGTTPLHLAINNNCSLEFIEFLIQRGADVNVKDEYGMSLLQLAIINDCPLEFINFLIQNGAYVNVCDKYGNTSLHMAILQNNKELVELFLKTGIGLDAKNKAGETPLHCAMNNSELAIIIIDKIVQSGNLTTLNIKDKNGRVPLMLAARNGQIDVVNHLTNKADFTAHDNDGYNALHHAILQGNEEMAKLLIEKNINLNKQGKNGTTPLHLAISKGFTDLAVLLINTGANLTIQNNDGYNALHLAAMQGNEKIVNLILEKDVNNTMLNAVSKDGRTLLHNACENGSIDIVKMILSKSKTNLDLPNAYGNTPLHRALMFGHEKVAEFLIDNGADITIADKKGQTPIHIACEKGLINVMTLLMAKKANIEAVAEGQTPLSMALKNGQLGCAKLLIESNANTANLQEDYADIIETLKTDETASLPIEDYIEETRKIFTDSLTDFYVEIQKMLVEKLEHGDLQTSLLKAVKSELLIHLEILTNKINNANKTPENPDTYKAELLNELQDIYLKGLFDMVKTAISESNTDRWEHFSSTLDVIHKTYVNKQKDLLKNQCNNSLVILEKMLEKSRLKSQEELEVLSKMVNLIDKHKVNEQLYLVEGVCYGATIEKAARSELGKKDAELPISPSKGARFYQAAYMLSLKSFLLSNKLMKENLLVKDRDSSYGDLDESFQKKLGVNIKSTKTISAQSVSDFIENIEILIPKLNTELSPNFALAMTSQSEKAAMHGTHAIYCHLSPPYEIQDVNFPPPDESQDEDFFKFPFLKTDDIEQFKMHLLLYFLHMAPCDYSDIEDVEQVSKRRDPFEQPKPEKTS